MECRRLPAHRLQCLSAAAGGTPLYAMLLPLNRLHFVSGEHEITYKALWQEAVELQGRELGMQRWRAHGRVRVQLAAGDAGSS